MHDHSFKNEHGRFPVTTDVLQNIQHDIQMLSKAIAGMGGDAAIFTKGGDVAAVDGEVVESHGRGQRIEKLKDPKNFAVQGEIYDVLETTGYLNDNFGRTHSNMFDLPSKFASLEAYDKQLRETIELRSKDILDYIDTKHNTFASQLGELRTQLAQAVAQLNNQIANIEKHTVPKGAIMLDYGYRPNTNFSDYCISRGFVPTHHIQPSVKTELQSFWGEQITFDYIESTRTPGWAVNACNGIEVSTFRHKQIRDKDGYGYHLYIKCL